MKYGIYILPLLAGVAIATQAVINAQLKVIVGYPLIAAFISFFIGTMALGVLILLNQVPFPSLTFLESTSLYKLSGGLLGAAFVSLIIISVSRIGASVMFSLVIAGQLITAMSYDHFGSFGLRTSHLDVSKVIGVTLLIVGAYLINKK
ncbi:MAG: DMT family transporter [Cyclobacteriaceae bacterium]|nr:DMT family transporter [Cyclobacteriaceae bacterium HetDA_MAG_MS6]